MHPLTTIREDILFSVIRFSNVLGYGSARVVTVTRSFAEAHDSADAWNAIAVEVAQHPAAYRVVEVRP